MEAYIILDENLQFMNFEYQCSNLRYLKYYTIPEQSEAFRFVKLIIFITSKINVGLNKSVMLRETGSYEIFE